MNVNQWLREAEPANDCGGFFEEGPDDHSGNLSGQVGWVQIVENGEREYVWLDSCSNRAFCLQVEMKLLCCQISIFKKNLTIYIFSLKSLNC